MSKLAIHYGKPLSSVPPYPSLAEMFLHIAEQYPHHGMRFFAGSGENLFLSYPEVSAEAWRYLPGLRQQGVKAGDKVILVVNHDLPAFYKLFWACLFGGIVVAPISQPSFEAGSPTLSKLKHIWQLLKKPLLIVEEKYHPYFSGLAREADWAGLRILPCSELYRPQGQADILHTSLPSDLAILQFSSGSTGSPKGVQLSHQNILTNLFAMQRGFELSPEDRVFSWLPHTHDMGLFFQYLSPLSIGSHLYLFSPLNFTRSPYLFLKKITEYRGTWFGSPNFGLDWMIKSISTEELSSLDLSSLRFILNGAEPISPTVMREFERKFSQCGLQKHRMRAAYGMAEVTVCATVTPPFQPLQIDKVDRHHLMNAETAVPPAAEQSEQFSLVHVGVPIEEISLRIADPQGNILRENQIGEVQICGPSVTCGYVHHKQASTDLFIEDWLRTGDLGYMRNGSLVIVGRTKDVIFIRGQNYFAHDLEETIFKAGLVARGHLLIIGQRNYKTEEEELVVFVRHKAKLEDFLALKREIHLCLRKVFHIEATHILAVSTIPKTTSGKLQRHVLEKKYQNGGFAPLIEQLQRLEEAAEVQAENEDLSGSDLEETLRDLWADILGISAKHIPKHAHFFELGGNSLKAFQLLDALSKAIQQEIDPELLVTCSTLQEIMDYVQTNYVLKNTPKNKKIALPGRGSASQPAIAITGMAFKLPDADTQQQWWRNLAAHKNSIRTISPKRRKLANQPKWQDWMAALEHIDYFDHEFFEISAQEAQWMDPQQRLTLETAYHALEDAGLSQTLDTEQAVGVYSGICMNSYLPLIMERLKHGDRTHPHALVSNLGNIIPARISSIFHFTGPSVAIDTACSSFLVALHQAVAALRQGALMGALVTSSNILVTPEVHALSSLAGILSTKNKVKVFDHKAAGTVLGEGVVVFYLERLDDALQAHKHIYGVIRGSAVNNDGGSYSLMAPNPKGQYQVLAQAYQDAGIAPDEMTYLEVHGTGTALGDFIEVNTLAKLFSQYPSIPAGSIGIGSVKTNVGHLLPAAGGAGLAKILLGFQHRQIAPTLHFRKPNPLLNLAQSPFYVVDQLQPWEGDEQTTRKAGLSSFGLGGTNAHVVLEEWRVHPPRVSTIQPAWHLLTVSAKTESALRRACQHMKTFLTQQPDQALADICFTRNRYRPHYDYRAAYILTTEHAQIIKTFTPKTQGVQNPKIIFMRGAVPLSLQNQVESWINMLREGVTNLVLVDCESQEFIQDSLEKMSPFHILLIVGKVKPTLVRSGLPGTKIIRVPAKSILDETAGLLKLMADLYVHGAHFNWEKLYPDGSGAIVHLPEYPFEPISHWVHVVEGEKNESNA